MNAIHLDQNATTAPDPAALDEVMPWLSGALGESSHILTAIVFVVRAVEGMREGRP